MIPDSRLRKFNSDAPAGACVVYWMISARRTKWNHGLQHAIEMAEMRNMPLVVIEPLAINHKWANDRMHTFMIQGMVDNKNSFEYSPITYIPYVESKLGEARGLLENWMDFADLIVMDDFPVYHPRKVLEKAISLNKCEVHCVDSNGFISLRGSGRHFTTAYSLRRHLQKTITTHLLESPHPSPLTLGEDLPTIDYSLVSQIFAISETPITPYEYLWRISESNEIGISALSVLDIDHSVPPVLGVRGGSRFAKTLWNDFFENKISNYSTDRNQPEQKGSSGLSPYLHFGHISPHNIVNDIFTKHNWDISSINEPNNGRRSGWWGLPADIEAFLDQIITWRDIGFIHCANVDNYDKFDSIPQWAQNSLAIHEIDIRPYIYSYEQFENAETHDELWNAAQRQLRTDGIIHNYLRMLWGKKILEWSPTPQLAMQYMIDLNDKWALDGRDPNSYTGIGWVLGKFDRGWTERPVFGKIRCMTTASTKRKFKTNGYMETYSSNAMNRSTVCPTQVVGPVNISFIRRD